MDKFKPTGELKPYNPPLRNKLGWTIAGLLEKLGLDKYGQQDVAEAVGTVADFIPGVGEAVGIDDTKRAYDEGDYLGAGISAAGTLAGVIPGVGDLAGKAIKEGGNVVETVVKKKIKDMAPDELRAYKAAKQAEARAKKREAEIAAGVEVKGRGRPVGSGKVNDPKLGSSAGEYVDEIDPNAEVQHDLVDELSYGATDYTPEPDRILNEELYLRGQVEKPLTEKDRRKAAADLFTERQKTQSLDKSVTYHAKRRVGENPGAGKPPLYRDRFNTQIIENPDGTRKLYDQDYVDPSPDPHKRYDLQGDNIHTNARLKRGPQIDGDWIDRVLEDIKRNGFEDLDDMPTGLDEVYEEAIRSRTPEGTSFTQGEGRVKGFQGPGKVEGDVVTSRYLKQPDYLPDETVIGGFGRRLTTARDEAEVKRLRDQAAKMFGKKVVDTGEAKLDPSVRDLVKQLSPQDIEYMLKNVPFAERKEWVKARLTNK
ncbi:hypothetical protein [Phyllobacterium sophorae]|uniref:Uncharacterized protein n=1 Tax=Phyllobacterium sophorae TaxID=1520277 RepID=A0A2P7BDY0_9HYPH|nr:hypothetical protein [Phyllobacterium sophorae]PSH64680.1 hypothetical protein CU103_12415 [Phyllobacterium sophorae]